MGIRLGVVGYGFAGAFIPLFQAHPLVEDVVVAELIPERLQETATRFNIRETYPSLTELCRSSVDAIAIFTNRHLHGAHTLEALSAGKHVYCAVPIASSLSLIDAIVKQVERSHLIYMTGETSYYYPSAIYCRDRFRKGDFGTIVYGQSAYLHDMSHGFYDAYRRSDRDEWKKAAGLPPMFYPTHSTSMILSVTGARVTNVACLGYVDVHADGVFKKGSNYWDNEFSNETALMRTSDGASMRVNEFRRVGWTSLGDRSVHLSLYGTDGCFEEQSNARAWTSISGEITDLTQLLACGTPAGGNQGGDDQHEKNNPPEYYSGTARVHPVHRLPKEFTGHENGHLGSHQFLVDDFVKAVSEHKLPPNHVWNAAKYCAPGLVAHESSQKNGEMMDVPDFGDPSESWNFLQLE